MQENKYFYNGISLSQYCKDNGIDISPIRTKIWKAKKSKKYEKYTEQEIVNMAVETYGAGPTKYMYEGMSLRQYCLKNDIKVSTINARIDSLKKKNKNLSNDELVILAMEGFDNQNFRFFYDGMPLKEYCNIHPEINYNTIRTYINREKEKNPLLTDDTIIEQYMEKEHKGIYKYYYLGIPLKQYCEKNNLSYKNIISYISRCKDDDKFKGLSDDDFIEAIMDQYQPFEPKYVYKGITLRKYCSQNNLSYYSVVSFVKRGLMRDSSKKIDDLIDEGIRTIKRYGIIYYYNGIPLKDYVAQHNLNVSSIRCSILRKQLKSDKPLQEIINECVESYQKFSIKYFYNDIPLVTFCNNVGLNYYTVIHKYLDEYSENKEISIDCAIKEIVDYYLENPCQVQTKYYFNNQSLAKFCDEKGYPYLAIWRRIKTIETKGNLLSTDEIVEQAIKKYEDRLQINKINEIFNKLKNNKTNNLDEIKGICSFLKIDFGNVIDLTNMGFTYNQAINMIWYFYDETIDEYKIITDKKIQSVFNLIDKLKKVGTNIEEFELYDFIGIYKSELYDSRNEILARQQKYIRHTIFSLCKNYRIDVNTNNFLDFESELKLYFIALINKISVNIYGQIIKYMDLTIKGYFRKYLKQYKIQNNCLSLDAAKYSNDGSKTGKPLIDYIADSNNSYERLENTSFSSNMLEVLSTLSPEDLSFIILKFQENYTDIELSEYFKIDIEEVQKREVELLSLLKDNPNIKVLKKTKNY